MSRRRAFLAALVLLVGVAGAKAGSETRAARTLSAEGLATVSTYIRNEVATGKIPGAILLLQQHGKSVYCENFGVRDVATAIPMSADTIFRLYSMSKPITSVMTMMLVEEGRLALEDPVAKYIPAFAEMKVGVERRGTADKVALTLEPQQRPVTIKDLLRHTAGLPYGATGGRAVRELYAAANLFNSDLSNADFVAKATGRSDTPSSYNVNFSGTARQVVVNENAFGDVTFKGNTANQILNADVTATLDGRPQVINGTINFGNENMPFRVATDFNQSPLAPFFALVPQLRGITIGGTGTGRVEFGGNLAKRDDQGKIVFTGEALTGSAQFSQLALQIQDTPLVASEPVVVRFNPREITFESARFAGGGSNVVIAGTKALTEDGVNNLTVDGRVNLSLLNAFPQIASTDTFFGGFANVAIRLAGVNRTARVSGTATLENAAVATFIGGSRLSFDRLTGRILFSSDQAQIADVRGYLGGGAFSASGGALFGEGLSVDSFRVALDGTNVTVPLPEDFITTGDAKLEITGRRGQRTPLLSVQIAGRILARRSLYTKDIELANIVGARHDTSLASGPSTIRAPRFDLTIEGRDALVVRNNIADLTASVSLRLTGTTENPQISGRITANSGTIFFRKDRYIVQRGVLEFPPDTAIEPVINLQAESEIAGYQVYVNLSGPLTDTEQLNATVRSSPALPQADVVSLITTGNLSNTESGIPTLAQTGINTAAEILTDTIINNPARKATDRLFGLNVFEIDPIISGQRLNASARLTVGRQINNNLRITYSTNLSQDQNQVLAVEYRVSNKLSFVAQYEQRSLSNVTKHGDNFSFEVRFRRRF